MLFISLLKFEWKCIVLFKNTYLFFVFLRRPTDMINLQEGHFAVRDDLGVQIFDDSGIFVKNVGVGIVDKCFGLATDGKVNSSLNFFLILTHTHIVPSNDIRFVLITSLKVLKHFGQVLRFSKI